MTSTVRILTTGGTIDKIYGASGEMEIGVPSVVRLLETGNCAIPVVVEEVFAKDSLDFDDADRARIAVAVAAAPETAVVITHGTDTMTDTADVLAAASIEGKTIVLVGAMQPAAMKDSDAAFNLGAALMAAQLAGSGIWVAMNGQLHPADRVRKDRARGRFVAAD